MKTLIYIIPNTIDRLCELIAKKTKPFVESKSGKIFLAIVMLGPLTFIPTLYQALTAPDINALKTLTWPLMLIVNASASLGVIHNGDWRIRITMILWVIMISFIWITTLIR